MPEYNSKVLVKQAIKNKPNAKMIREDNIGEKYYATDRMSQAYTGRLYNENVQVAPSYNVPYAPKAQTAANNGFVDKHQLVTTYPEKENIASNVNQPFVSLNDIDFNGSKNISNGQRVTLTNQNVVNKKPQTVKYNGSQTEEVKSKPQVANGLSLADIPDGNVFTKPFTAPQNTTPIITKKQSGYYINAGIYDRESVAKIVSKRLEQALSMPIDYTHDINDESYNITIGPVFARKDADVLIKKMVEAGHYDAKIKKVD
jgi:hypothetical protein